LKKHIEIVMTLRVMKINYCTVVKINMHTKTNHWFLHFL